MRGVNTVLMSMLTSFFISFSQAGVAASEQYSTNGAIAATMETKLQDFLMGKEMDGFKYGIYQQGADYAQGTGYVSSNPKREFFDRHIAAHCSTNVEAEKQGFNCQGAGSAAPEDQKYFEFGDIKFSVLLEPDKYTEGTSIMAQSLIRNIVNPFPDSKWREAVSSGSLEGDSKARDEYSEFLASQAVSGVALYAMNEMYGMRVTGQQANISDQNDPAFSMSVLSAMEAELTRRFFGEQFGSFSSFEDWLKDSNTNQIDVLKEQARMQAVSLWMEYMRFRQGERIEALIAAALAHSVNSSQATKKMFGR